MKFSKNAEARGIFEVFRILAGLIRMSDPMPVYLTDIPAGKQQDVKPIKAVSTVTKRRRWLDATLLQLQTTLKQPDYI